MLRLLPAAALLATSVAVPQAHASIFSSTELSYDNALLSQFNLVTLNQTAANSTVGGTDTLTTVAGRAIVGGDATFTSSSSSVCAGNCGTSINAPGNATSTIDGSSARFGALTVFGKLVTPNSQSPINYLSVGSGDVSVKGTANGNILLNSAGSNTGGFGIVGSAAGANTGNAASVKTTQPTYAGNSYNYSSTGTVSNGVTPQVNQTLASVFPFASTYQTEVKTLAKGIAALPGSPNVTTQSLSNGSSVFFTAYNDYTYAGKKYGVITTTLANLASIGTLQIDNNGNDATLVIVTGNTMDSKDANYNANAVLPTLTSYSDDSSKHLIFDFVDATTLKFGGNWNGSILAPLANITQTTGTINGSVIVNSISQTQALLATNLFTGDLTGLIPEPASLALLGAGVAAAGLMRRRRR